MHDQELTREQFEAFLDEGVTPAEEFRPVAFPDREGDSFEFFASNEPFKAERIDNNLTVYVGRDTKAVVGALIRWQGSTVLAH
jgi:hypothetical protein